MRRRRNGFREFLIRFSHHRAAMAAAAFFSLLVLAVFLVPVFISLDPVTADFRALAQAPSREHLLGTDEVGRDVLARIFYGGRVSLTVGFLSCLLSMCIGVPLGLIAGYYEGLPGNIIMRLAEMFMSFPSMVLALVLVAVFKPSILTVVFAIGILGWTRLCKLLYANVLAVKRSEYVQAAVAVGVSDIEVMTRYIIPNAVSPLWVTMAFSISAAIIMETSLSFLGVGIQPPASSWGNIIYAAQQLNILTGKLWIWLPASLILLLTIISINLIGEGIRDALDPRMKY